MKKICLFVLGFIPLGAGFLMDRLMMQFSDVVFPFRWIGIGFLAFWVFLGFATYSFRESARTSLCLVHFAAFFALILNLYQEIQLGQYWGNLLSVCTQLFYLPMINILVTLTVWSNRIWVAYIAGFFLLCITYYMGFKIRKQRTK